MTAYYTDPLATLYLGDCLTVMAELPAESIDAIVTDPPYGLKFMGKTWDHGVPATPFWSEMYRLAKPGAYLLAFGGTRTVHRIATNIEDAGWIIRDMLVWGYASGFPKGRANLKPAWEPIVMARKPGPLRHLAIDECRIPGAEDGSRNRPPSRLGSDTTYAQDEWTRTAIVERNDTTGLGRWPANVILTYSDVCLVTGLEPPSCQEHLQCPTAIFDGGIEGVVGGGETGSGMFPHTTAESMSGIGGYSDPLGERTTDSGTYSRFFLIPKADRAERERGLSGTPVHVSERTRGDNREWDIPGSHSGPRLNHHPTVKPIELMRHLVRLVTPSGGTVLDPFLGSGTTALAASEEGFHCIGIEREADYLDIARGRLIATPMGMGLSA